MKTPKSSKSVQHGAGVLRACITTMMAVSLAFIQTGHALEPTVVIDYTGTLVSPSGAACNSYNIAAFEGASFHWKATVDKEHLPRGPLLNRDAFAATITLQLSNAGVYSGTHTPTANTIMETSSDTYNDLLILSNSHYFDVSNDDPVELWMGTLGFPSGTTGGGKPGNTMSTFKSSDIVDYRFFTITDGGNGHCYYTISNGVANGTQDYLYNNGFEASPN